MTTHRALTPTQFRTRYHEHRAAERSSDPSAHRLGLVGDDIDGTATAEWLAPYRGRPDRGPLNRSKVTK